MALKMIQLVLCSMLALTATCQRLTNGNFLCGKSIEEVGNYHACSKKTTIVHYDIKNLESIAALKKHEKAWTNSSNYFKRWILDH